MKKASQKLWVQDFEKKVSYNIGSIFSVPMEISTSHGEGT